MRKVKRFTAIVLTAALLSPATAYAGNVEDAKALYEQVTEKQIMLHSAAGLEESSSTEEQIRSIEKKNLGMVIAAFLAVLVGIVGIIGSFQFTDEMTKIGMDICIIAAIVTVIYTLTVRRKLRSDLARLKKKKTRMQAQREKLKWNRKTLTRFIMKNLQILLTHRRNCGSMKENLLFQHRKIWKSRL